MPLSANDTERAERVLIRNIAKRDNAVSQMSLLYDLAQSVQNDAKCIPMFRARKMDIDTLLSQFRAEQDGILDLLIQLKRNAEYDRDHAPLNVSMSNHYYHIMAISNELGIGDLVPPSTTTNVSQESSHIQLPKIQIPTFDGELLRWVAFRDTYRSLVHDNVSLSKIEKFHYLLSAVTGGASAVVRSISLSDSNYDVAWNALNDRFDNPRLIMNSHLDQLFRFAPLCSPSLDDLKRFLDIFHENIAAFRSFNIPDQEGFLFFYIASSVLDSNTKCLFEAQHNSTTLPIIDDLLKFIQTRCQVLQNSSTSLLCSPSFKSKPSQKPVSSPKKNSTSTRLSLLANASEPLRSCSLCNGPHPLYRCDKFLLQPIASRLKTAQSCRLCRNCLSPTHDTSRCTSKYSCRHCSSKHHSLLHFDTNKSKGVSSACGSNNQSANGTPLPQPSTSSTDSTSPVFVGTASTTNLSVLGTATIRIRDQYGHWVTCRALIDSGSQVSAITHTCASRLGLTRRRSAIDVVGLAHTPISHIKGVTSCHFISRTAAFPEYSCSPIILSKITGIIPAATLNPCIRSKYSDLEFADPSFDIPGNIDLLLGADVYNQLFMDGYRVRHLHGLPSAFETGLGWIFMGTTSQYSTYLPQTSLTLSIQPSLGQLLHRFWEVEEPIVSSTPFTEEQKCEDLFMRTTVRDQLGRYTVTFPFKSDPSVLGGSRTLAISRFLNLERKLQSDQELYNEYRAFMDEYIQLGHMQITTTPGKYIIPHHAVVKVVNNKIKLRVVFDASARTSSGSSLNDIVFTGQKLQQDISTILMSCRLQRFMFTADICKMYRQINMSPAGQQYQHVLWRNSPSDQLSEYALSTVTYGVACSPFQAIRVLHQLEKDEGPKYPATKGVLSSQTYVDDIITGANTLQSVLTLQKQVCQLLLAGGFQLKKWASNCPEVLDNIPIQDRVIELSFDPKDDTFVKILGLHWDPAADVFSYHSDPVQVVTTKRAVLSSIAKIYDPLGALAPIIFWAKCFMQRLWKDGYTWDHPLSEELSSAWTSFSSELPAVANVKICRHIPVDESCDAQLVGFSDASLKGYAAVVYLRLSYETKPTTIHLVTSKSKVAPLKTGRTDDLLSVPRLELCGALLLAQVLHRVQQTITPIIKLSSIHAWTDSTVVLSWLTSSQVQFKVFVTNRINKIHELLPNCYWHHVTTEQNPADCVSRGMFPKETISHTLYWAGPSFLFQSSTEWSLAEFHPLRAHELPEQVNLPNITLTVVTTDDLEWFHRFSTLTRLQRVIVQMRRFADRAQRLPTSSGFMSNTELEGALRIAIKITQLHEFHDLFKNLSSNAACAIPSSVARLAPFVDAGGLIRVGGRLRHSNATEDSKFPFLLPKFCVLTTLLVRYYHIKYLHAGPQLVSSLLSSRFWILSSRSAIHLVIFKCVTCARQRANKPAPLMGDLPKARVCPSRPFSNVGIDYAGPLLIKDGKRRNARSVKCYLAIFVCMAVKAVHIEVVSDLSTPAFIASLNRFVSRRGIPSHIYSDCGTNFQGGDAFIRSQFQDSSMRELCSNQLPCQWHFNPPAAPHFGGLWEAAVKSTKYHLKRVIGCQMLTFEELSTLTQQIEAVLNSRPLTPLSADPGDLRALTPGHFLIGSPLVALPEPDQTAISVNRLTRWQLLNQLHQSFWKRWSSEYLTTLQSRSKWYRKHNNVAIGDFVLVHHPNSAPTSWKLGRVELTHPGEDGVVRVATIRTSEGTYKRPVVKLTVLPTSDDL